MAIPNTKLIVFVIVKEGSQTLGGSNYRTIVADLFLLELIRSGSDCHLRFHVNNVIRCVRFAVQEAPVKDAIPQAGIQDNVREIQAQITSMRNYDDHFGSS
jgi:hypothetical protein